MACANYPLLDGRIFAFHNSLIPTHLKHAYLVIETTLSLHIMHLQHLNATITQLTNTTSDGMPQFLKVQQRIHQMKLLSCPGYTTLSEVESSTQG